MAGESRRPDHRLKPLTDSLIEIYSHQLLTRYTAATKAREDQFKEWT